MSAALTPPWLCLTTEVAALPWLCNVGSNSEHCIQLNEGWLSLPWRQAQALAFHEGKHRHWHHRVMAASGAAQTS